MTTDEHPAAASGAKREKLNVLPYDLVPFQEMTDAYVRVAEFGAKKYAPWNWSKGLSRVQIIGSLIRHTFAYLRGEECDKDSGLLHTDHILWNAAALSHNVRWCLEDGRRAEPRRAYKDYAEGGRVIGPGPVNVVIKDPVDFARLEEMMGSPSPRLFQRDDNHVKSENHGEE